MRRNPNLEWPSRTVRTVLVLIASSLVGSSVVSCTTDLEDEKEEIQLLFRAERIDEAMPRLEALVDRYPADLELNRLYGKALFALGSPSMAIWPLRKATEAPEATPEDWVMLAKAHLLGGSPTDAIAVVDRLLERTPGIIEAYDLRIEANIALNQSEKALEDVEFLLDDRPQNESLLIAKATLLVDLERAEEAKETIAAARALMGESEEAEEWAARFCAVDATFIYEDGGEGHVERALERWEACVESHPADALVVGEAVSFFDANGRPDRGEPILRRAVEEAPKNPGFRIMLSQRLLALGELEEAEQELREAIALRGGMQARSLLIEMLSEQQRFDEALAVLEEWIEASPNPSASMQILRADLIVRSDRFAAAEEAIAALPAEEFRNVLMGRLMLRRGEPREALELLEKGIALWPSNAVARVLAAEAAEQLGYFDRAFNEYVEACRNEPGNWEALSRLGAKHIAIRRSEPFGQLFNRYIAERPNHVDAIRLLFDVGLAGGRQEFSRSAIQRLAAIPMGLALSRSLAAKMRARTKPAEAVSILTQSHLDLTSPRNADALATLVEILGPLERHKHAIARADAAVAAHPDFPRFHEIRAAALADSGAPSAEIRAALERALELDANLAPALTRLGRLDAAEGRIEAAVALFDRAAAADRENSTPEWAAIEVLKDSGKPSDIDARLEKLVGRRIEHADAVDLLARRLAERGKDPERAKRYSDLAARLKAY
jgi:predicted Zn-dependent protease